MMRGALRDLRLLPIVIISAGALLFLKLVGFASGDLTSAPTRPARAQEAPIPGIADPSDREPLTTGAVPSTPRPAAAAPPPPAAAPAANQPPPISATERAILERLQERRQELEARQRELEMRENLLKAAERRLEQRAEELKELEGRITSLEIQRDAAEQQRFRGVVGMYESMRARDAARIFDTLELSVLVEVARAMRPAKLADVMAAMQAEPARRLTIELARRPQTGPQAGETRPTSLNDLPRIEGRPTR